MTGFAFDYTITAGNMIEAGIFVVGGIVALATLKTTVTTLKDNVEASKRETKESIAGLQFEIKKIGEILVNQADQNRRIIHLEDDVRELRHGRGFVQGPGGVDREYPGG
jgi:uncharacterized UPF0160 family protein